MIYPNTIGTIGEKIAYEQGYDAGRADFITSELPKLLEMARYGEVKYTEQALSDDAVFKYTIQELLLLATRGET